MQRVYFSIATRQIEIQIFKTMVFYSIWNSGRWATIDLILWAWNCMTIWIALKIDCRKPLWEICYHVCYYQWNDFMANRHSLYRWVLLCCKKWTFSHVDKGHCWNQCLTHPEVHQVFCCCLLLHFSTLLRLWTLPKHHKCRTKQFSALQGTIKHRNEPSPMSESEKKKGH